MLKELLKKLNFSEGEVKIYSYLNHSGEQAVKEIALNSELSLSKTYEILEKLELKQIVSKITKNNKKFYQILPLESLQNIIDKNKKELKKKEELLQKIITQKKKNIVKQNNTNIRIFSGYNGIKSFYLELENNNTQDEYLGFQIDDIILKNKNILRLIDNFHKKRSQTNKISKVIIEDNKNYNTIRLKENPYAHYEFKATKKTFPKNLSIIGNKIIHYNINPDEEKYEIIEIESKSLSETYKNLFTSIWNNNI